MQGKLAIFESSNDDLIQSGILLGPQKIMQQNVQKGGVQFGRLLNAFYRKWNCYCTGEEFLSLFGKFWKLWQNILKSLKHI